MRWNKSWCTNHVADLPQFVSTVNCMSSALQPRKHLLVLKTCWRPLQDMSWRRLQHVFSLTILRLPIRLPDVLKTSCKTFWIRLGRQKFVMPKTSSRRLEDMSWRHLEDISWRRLEDIMDTNKILTGNICMCI